MDAEHRRIVSELRTMPSEQAADWLMSQFPREADHWGSAILMLDHVALSRADNLKLARHYLTGLPFASGRVYEVFARRLSLPDLTRIISEALPDDPSRLDLLLYYLEPALATAVKSPSGEEAVRSLIAEIEDRQKKAL